MNARKALTMLVALTIGGLAVGGSAAQASATAAKPMPGQASASAMADDLLSMDYVARIRTLTSYESVLRKLPKAASPHNYRYTTTTNYWSAVVAWSPTTGNADLQLFDDKAHTQLLNYSGWGAWGLSDFVAVDSNHRPFGTYFPQVDSDGGTGSYYVEVAEGAAQLGSGSVQLPMGSGDIVAVRDTYLVAGNTYTFTLAPGSVSQDGDMFLMQSMADASGSWTQSRAQAKATAASKGAGQTETFQFTPSVSDWYGLVIINELLGGTYTLTRS